MHARYNFDYMDPEPADLIIEADGIFPHSCRVLHALRFLLFVVASADHLQTGSSKFSRLMDMDADLIGGLFIGVSLLMISLVSSIKGIHAMAEP